MKKNSKGFTLIELLAVIVILGILLMTAIPAITKNIAKSRRNTYWQNAKEYIKAVSTPFLAGEYVKTNTSEMCSTPAPGQAVGVYIKNIELEQGDIKKSSFGSPYVFTDDNSNTCQPMVVVKNGGSAATDTTEQKDKLVWYFVGTDQAGNGIEKLTSEANLNLAAVKTGGKKSGCTINIPTENITMCQPQ